MSTVLTQDQIRLTGLSARGYHGMLPGEREEGQLFVVDAELRLGVRGTAVTAVTDSLRDAVDYSAVAAAIVDVIEGEPVNLIETLAARVAEAALAFEAVREVEVTVHKPQAPLEVAFEDVSVTIVRRSEEDLTAAPSAGRSAFLAAPPAPAAPAAHAAAPPLPEPGAESAASPVVSSVEEAAAAAPPAVEDSSPLAQELPEAPLAVQVQDALIAGIAPEPPAPADALGAGAVASAVGLAGAAGMAEAVGLLDEDAAVPVQEEAASEDLAAPLTEPAQDEAGQEEVAQESAASAEPMPADQGGQAPAPAPEPAPAPPAPRDLLAQTPEQAVEAVIALGGNVGGVVPALRQAVSTLRSTPGVTITDVAPLARTAAVVPEGGAEQPDYLNTVVLVTLLRASSWPCARAWRLMPAACAPSPRVRAPWTRTSLPTRVCPRPTPSSRCRILLPPSAPLSWCPGPRQIPSLRSGTSPWPPWQRSLLTVRVCVGSPWTGWTPTTCLPCRPASTWRRRCPRRPQWLSRRQLRRPLPRRLPSLPLPLSLHPCQSPHSRQSRSLLRFQSLRLRRILSPHPRRSRHARS